MPNWLHKCLYTCWLTHARPKWLLHQQPASLPALEEYLIPLLSWKERQSEGLEMGRGREKRVEWVEKNNRKLGKLSGQRRVWQQIRELLQLEPRLMSCGRPGWWALLCRRGQSWRASAPERTTIRAGDSIQTLHSHSGTEKRTHTIQFCIYTWTPLPFRSKYCTQVNMNKTLDEY